MTMVLLISIMPGVQAATLTNSQIEGAISWASNRLGNQSYNYYCLAFVSDAWKSQGIGNKGYAYATLAGNAMITHTDKNPPRGAVVFWDWYGTVGGEYRNWGHVGIALGDGTAIHADYNGVRITKLDIDSSRKYRGWGGWDGRDIPNVDLNKSRWRVTVPEGINVRSAAGTGHSKVGAIPYNAYFYITERIYSGQYTWGKVDNYNGITGWCVLDYAQHISGPIPEIKNDISAPIHQDTVAHVRDGYFTFKNASSGTFLNVWGGADQDGTEVTTWTFDGSIDQRFNVVHKGNGKYKLYAECSNNGSNRVVDIRRGNNAVAEGQSVELWTPNDDTAQLFYIWPVNDTEYVFEIASKEGYVIAPSASAANSNSKSSQLKVQKYTGAPNQKWILCNHNGNPTQAFVTYAPGSYKLDTGGTPVRFRTGPGVNNSVVGSVPDKTVVKVTQVDKNWGYINYDGKSGWILLDFLEYTVTLDSITISTMPDKMSYCTGDKFDPLGMKLKVYYSNGQFEEITTGFTASADFSTPGDKQVTISYKGKTTSFLVNVKDINVSELDIEETLIKRTYSIGDTLDTTGLSLIVTYNNGTTTLVDSGFTADYATTAAVL